MDAIYIGIVFINTLFMGGKGIIIFAVFGLEYDTVIKPLIKWVSTVQSLYKEPDLVNEDDPRLYHWTLYLIQRLFRVVPRKQYSKQYIANSIIPNNYILNNIPRQ